MKLENSHRVIFLFFVVSLFSRLAWIDKGLPQLLFPDEPHHLNIAAYFGTGDFNPHDFKYPTLWSYVIAALFGFMFLFQKLFNGLPDAHQFALNFICNPTTFYVAVRCLAATLVSCSCLLIFSIGKKYFSVRVGLLSGFLAAFSLPMFEQGRDGTLYGLTLFLLAWTYFFLYRFYESSGKNKAFLAHLFLGFSLSAHYIVAPLIVVPILIWWKFDRHAFSLIKHLGIVLLGFFVGSPFLFIDFYSAFSSLSGLYSAHHAGFTAISFNLKKTSDVIHTVISTVDPFGIGIILCAIGFLLSSKGIRAQFFIWLSPIFILFPAMFLSQYGAASRYCIILFYPLFLLAGIGFDGLWERFSKSHSLTFLLLILPCVVLLEDIRYLYGFTLPDTRVLAKAWIAQKLPPEGKRFLLTDAYRCPQLKMSNIQAADMFERTKESKHIRSKYYELLKECSGQGYEVYLLRHDAGFLADSPLRTEKSYQAQAWIELGRDPINEIRVNNINYVIADGDSMDFYDWEELFFSNFRLVASFRPEERKVQGPHIFIFEIK